jgi:ATP-dependent Clp protease adaptor protein ClpS
MALASTVLHCAVAAAGINRAGIWAGVANPADVCLFSSALLPGAWLQRVDRVRRIPPMDEIITRPTTKDEIKVERPRLHKVILVNDDYTPREFVVLVLKAVFRMNEDQAARVMITAHRRGTCVVAVYTKDVAETKATNATDAGRSKGYPLLFTTEPEE